MALDSCMSGVQIDFEIVGLKVVAIILETYLRNLI